MARREVALVVHEGVQALDVVGPLDVFAEANASLGADDRYRCRLVARTTAPLRASNGMAVSPDLGFADATRRFDTVLVAGGPSLPGAPPDASLSEWLRRWGARAGRYGSVCTGAFPLGDAGLLDRRVVTTHWQNAGALAARFPDAHVQPDRIYSRDGPLVTSAGVTAGIDLALALVREDHGGALSLACAKRLVVVAQRQGGQSQFSPLLLPVADDGEALARVQAYVVENLRERLSAERLAEVAGTSVRTLARRFAEAAGSTPHDYVEGVRLDRARNLLEGTDRPLKAVAYACGFATAEQMRHAFQRRLGIGPARYRESFRPAPPRRHGGAGQQLVAPEPMQS